jgi:hypothetical protein
MGGLSDANRKALAQARERAERSRPRDLPAKAHVHGVVELGEDVEAVVVDPSFRGTAVAYLWRMTVAFGR